MRLESSIASIHNAGAEVIAISVDSDERQAGMVDRWKLKNVRLVADPGGDNYLKNMGLYDPEDRGGIALPGNLVIGPDGTEAYRYEGRDFADRTTDTEVFEALTDLSLDRVDPEPWKATATAPDDLDGFFPVSSYVPYFAGNRFGAMALARRLPNHETVAIAQEHGVMADKSLKAWKNLTGG